jgi:outer membrane protein
MKCDCNGYLQDFQIVSVKVKLKRILMKNLSLIVNVVLAVAVIVLFVMVFDLKKSSGAKPDDVKVAHLPKEGKLPIAYVNIDSLLLNYKFAKESNEALIKKQESSRLTVNVQAQSLQKEMVDFQKKLQNNAFLSRERAEQEQIRIQKKQQDLQQLDQKLSQQLMQEQQKMSTRLRDTINKFMKDFNKGNKYQMIISNTSNDNVLYAAKAYDITNEVTKQLNERFDKK